MAQMTKTIVKIAGREYTIRAEETEEYIHNVAIYVNRKMDEIMKSNPSLSTSMASVLTAINLGDEVLKLQAEVEVLKKKADQLQAALDKQTAPVFYDVSRKSKK